MPSLGAEVRAPSGGGGGDAAPRRAGRARPFPARLPLGFWCQRLGGTGRVSAGPGLAWDKASGAGRWVWPGAGGSDPNWGATGERSGPELARDAGSRLRGVRGGSGCPRIRLWDQGADPAGLGPWVPSGPGEGGAVFGAGSWGPAGAQGTAPGPGCSCPSRTHRKGWDCADVVHGCVYDINLLSASRHTAGLLRLIAQRAAWPGSPLPKPPGAGKPDRAVFWPLSAPPALHHPLLGHF